MLKTLVMNNFKASSLTAVYCSLENVYTKAVVVEEGCLINKYNV